MDKKVDRAAGQSRRSSTKLGKPVEDELRALYAKYGEEEPPPHMKALAAKLAEACGEQKPAAAAVKSAKPETAE